jgi:cytochrome c556
MKFAMLAGALFILPLAGVQAQEDDPHIAYRQKVMKSIGANMGAIGDIMKNELPLQENIAVHARALQLASGLIPSAFKKEIVQGRTEAMPAIWQEWDKYVAAANKLGEASAALVEAAQGGDAAAIDAALQAVGGSCGGCHKHFRKPKE